MNNFNTIFKSLLAVALSVASMQISARNINVRGKVLQQVTEEPLYGVSIFDTATDKFVGATNDEGKFTVNVPDDCQLTFKVMGCEEKTVSVDGKLTLDVALSPKARTLDEVVVKAKVITNALVTEPTDIEVRGNYLTVNTHVKVPHQLFNSSMRMVIQPSIYNITTRKRNFMRPVVFDGSRYNKTQERMYDWNNNSDPLNDYVIVKTTGRHADDIIGIKDSVYVRNPNQDYRCDIFTSLESYNSIIYSDTIMIARGTINPMRFLSYSLVGSPVVDEQFFPTPEMQLRDTKGDVRLTFTVGRSNLDMSLGDNLAEMDRLLAQLREIESNPDMAIKSFTISGTASPEGNYESNLKLAKGRMSSAMDVILQGLDATTRRNMDVRADADVASWSEVVKLLNADGYSAEAEQIQEIIDRYPNSINNQSRKIVALPCYANLIKTNYLPKLRNVTYEFVTSRYRYLTDDEIKELYATNSKDMSRYEFWRLYSQTDSADREPIIRRALEVHPRFLVGATDLADILIKRDEYDVDLIQPLLISAHGDVPNESRLNQGISFLRNGQYTSADSILSLTPDTPLYHKAKIYSAALNGRYMDVAQEISADSPINEVVLLLSIKSNDEAWRKAQALGDSAIEEYIKAIAANRTDNYMAAIGHLDKALALDPSLIDLARVDGDVVDLLTEEQKNVSNKE